MIYSTIKSILRIKAFFIFFPVLLNFLIILLVLLLSGIGVRWSTLLALLLTHLPQLRLGHLTIDLLLLHFNFLFFNCFQFLFQRLQLTFEKLHVNLQTTTFQLRIGTHLLHLSKLPLACIEVAFHQGHRGGRGSARVGTLEAISPCRASYPAFYF